MKIQKVIAIVSIVCMSVQYAAQEQSYNKQLQSIITKYSGTQKTRVQLQVGAKKIHRLFLRANKAGKAEEFMADLLAVMRSENNALLPLRAETCYYMFNQKNGDTAFQKLRSDLVSKLKNLVIESIKPFILNGVEGLLRAYDIFPPENVNQWLLKEFSTKSGNALVTGNKIQIYLAKEYGTVLGTDHTAKGTVNLLNSYVRDYHIFQGQSKSIPKPTAPTISQESQELYLQEIADILNDDSLDHQKKLQELYDEAIEEGNVASIQMALAKLYGDEVKNAERLPGPVMDFCRTLMPSLTNADNAFKKGVVDAWQTALSPKIKPSEQKLVDMFNFLLEPGNAEIVTQADVVPNMYVDAVIQGVRTVTVLQNNDLNFTTQLSRLRNILGGSGNSSSLSDMLQKVGIGVTAEDTERDSAEVSDSDLFNTNPRVWYVIAHNLLDAASGNQEQLAQVEEVLKNSRRNGKFTTLKSKVSRWFTEYGRLQNLRLKWNSSSLKDDEKYNLAMKEIVNDTLQSSIDNKPIDPEALCVSVSVVLKTLTGKLESDRQPEAILKQLQEVDGVTLEMIHAVIIDQLPRSLQSQFIKALGSEEQSNIGSFKLPGNISGDDENGDNFLHNDIQRTTLVKDDSSVNRSGSTTSIKQPIQLHSGAATSRGMSEEEREHLEQAHAAVDGASPDPENPEEEGRR